MTHAASKGRQALSTLRIMFIAILATIPMLGTQFLLEGERLYAGQYIVSENGRFRFGLSAAGRLELLDTNPDPGRRSAFPWWDGKILWHAERDVLQTGFFHSWGEAFFQSWMRKMGAGKNHQMTDRSLQGAHFFEIINGNDFIGRKVLTLFDSEEKPLWKLDIFTQEEKELYLLVEDCGRVIGLNESKIWFCTCPYCASSADYGNVQLDHHFLDFYFNDGVLGMPLHPGSGTDIRKKVTPYPYQATDEAIAGLRWGVGREVLKEYNLNELTDYRTIWKKVRWKTYDRFWKRVETYTGVAAPGPSGVTYASLLDPEETVSHDSCPSMGLLASSTADSFAERKVPQDKENTTMAFRERKAGNLDLPALFKQAKSSERPKEFK